MLVEVVVAGRDPPLSIELCESSKPTVAAIKSAIYRRTLLNPRKHQLRLIVDGQLLPNDVSLSLRCSSVSGPSSKRCRVLLGSVIHCSVSECPSLVQRPSKTDLAGQHVSDKSRTSLSGTAASQTFTTLLPRSCDMSIDFRPTRGDRDATDSEVEETESRTQSRSDTALQEIVVTSTSNASYSSSNVTSPSYVLRAPPLEFGQESGPSLEDEDEMVGDLTDFCSGCMLGCGLGLIMLLLTFDKTIVFSKKFQDGVRLGVIFNFAFAVLLLVSEGEHPSLF